MGFLRADVNGFRDKNFEILKPTSIFDKLTADFIYTINKKSKAAIEVTFQ
jgi:hypothetical protein